MRSWAALLLCICVAALADPSPVEPLSTEPVSAAPSPVGASSEQPASATPPPADQLFKWVDADGHVHYSQTPPPSTSIKPEVVKVAKPQQYSTGVPVPVDPALQPTLPRDSEAAAQARADAHKAQQAARKQALKQQKCEDLKSRLNDVAADAGPNPDASKLQAMQQARQQLADECGI